MGKARAAHRVLGLILVLPLCGWALTGLVFFIKPGYEAAYAGLRVRTYPLVSLVDPIPERDWLEVRYLKTILGDHLLVRSEKGWAQLDPSTHKNRELPDSQALQQLVEDAIAPERERYGTIATVTPDRDSASASIRTSTGVAIDLDWSSLGLSQSGKDTRRIDALYRVHYLQWTGIRMVDRVLGILGIVLLLALAALGIRIAFGSPS